MSDENQDDASLAQTFEPSRTLVESVELAPEEFYYEGQYMVFTAAYHLKRGYCCNSDCRHCPYR